MQFDPENHIVKLCAQGMDLEGRGKKEEALELFQRAWNESANDLEQFIAAHYIARHQPGVKDKLKWDEVALSFALKVKGNNIEAVYPSLYLNIGKCYEDMKEWDKAKENYQLALSFAHYLSEDGYGKMIRSGIENGIGRTGID